MIFTSYYKPVVEDYDKNEKLTLTAILKILENAGNDHSDSAGDSVIKGSNNGKAWILTDWKIEIIQRPSYGEKITTETWIEPISSPFGTSRDFLLYANDTLCVKGTTRWVLLDITTMRPTKITEELEQNYTTEEKFVFSEKKLEKIPIPENFSFQKEIVLRRSDIDFNNHVHNLFYLDFALEALPDEVYKNEQFSSIRITYKNAITEGEQVVARYAKLDAKHIVCIFSHDVVKTLVELG